MQLIYEVTVTEQYFIHAHILARSHLRHGEDHWAYYQVLSQVELQVLTQVSLGKESQGGTPIFIGNNEDHR